MEVESERWSFVRLALVVGVDLGEFRDVLFLIVLIADSGWWVQNFIIYDKV